MSEMTAKRLLASVAACALAALAIPAAADPAETRVLGPGVSRDTIKIGVHGPATGASPLPSDSLQRGAEVYWRWRRQIDRPIQGRHVEAIFRNDNYNPSQAVAVCKEMVEKENVFMLSGLINPEGKDQVQSCARYAASVGVPYVSLGQTKIALKRLPRYFAFSKSWPGQARMLADLLIDKLGARREKTGMVTHDQPNYADSHDAFVHEMSKRDAPIDYNRSVPKTAGAAEAETVVQELKAAGIRNVFVLVRPIWFLQLVNAAESRDYHPQWTSIGMTISSHDSLVRAGCNDGGIRGMKVLTPLPGFADRNDFDPTYSRAMRRIYSDPGDMVTWLGWGTSRQLAKLLDRTGRDLSRKRFVRRTERARRVHTGILPALNFRPRDHFGGKRIHVVVARCRDERWHTLLRFKRNF